MLYISYDSVCEMETQLLFLGFIEKGELGKAKKA